ncbi:Cyclin-dependent kinase [Handroanthus impetiginosus]|uniref:Cyclin-dependent kinase n=1 Tax=Handroanthus impetiginosus TaxID=429701 RepID=A0A2G9H2A4_9LAMI|nr:Cyclin-dependent kinase [Handroanthus impetiginosus]
METFKDFPPASLALIDILLSIDPDARGTATAALNSEFFTTEPYACEPSSLPKFPPSKEIDMKVRDEEARRQRNLAGKSHAIEGNRRARVRDKVARAIPAPEANAELQTNLDRLRIMSKAKAKSKSEKFPPPHQDGAVGHPRDASQNGPASFGTADAPSTSTTFDPKSSRSLQNSTSKSAASRSKNINEEPQRPPSRKFLNAFYPSTIRLLMDLRLGRR